MTIEVTAADIEMGRIARAERDLPSRSCPVYQALKRLGFPDPWSGFISLGWEDRQFTVPEIGAFTHAFDRGGLVEPFTFELPDTANPTNGGKS